jgi:hypothetical protein
MVAQDIFVALLQLGGQYLVPAAILLRALYSGSRGDLPEGFSEIAIVSFLAGLTAVANGQEEATIRSVGLEILGNTAFMAGLLGFIVIYLLNVQNRGQIVDGVIGGIIGGIAWAIWVYILGNDLPWWTAPFVIAGGVAGFIALRIALRTIYRLVQIATYLLRTGIALALVGGAIYLAILIF